MLKYCGNNAYIGCILSAAICLSGHVVFAQNVPEDHQKTYTLWRDTTTLLSQNASPDATKRFIEQTTVIIQQRLTRTRAWLHTRAIPESVVTEEQLAADVDAALEDTIAVRSAETSVQMSALRAIVDNDARVRYAAIIAAWKARRTATHNALTVLIAALSQTTPSEKQQNLIRTLGTARDRFSTMYAPLDALPDTYERARPTAQWRAAQDGVANAAAFYEETLPHVTESLTFLTETGV